MKPKKTAWEKIYKEKGKFFETPHPDIDNFVKLLKKQKAKNVLDFGSGTGRHVVYLAKKGFSVVGIDISKTGINMTKNWLQKEGSKADLVVRDMTKPIPYSDNFFDGVISTQVIHHAERHIVKNIIDEITRVTKSGGVIFITVPLYKGYSKKRPGWKMKKIAKKTFLPLDGQEKGMVHYFFTADEFKKSFPKFKILKAYMDKTNHYAILATKNTSKFGGGGGRQFMK